MFFVTTNFLVTPLLKRCVWLGSFCETVPGVALIEEKCLQMMLCSNNQCAGWVRHCQPMSSLSSRLVGLGVWFSLWVREVPGSNPGRAHQLFFRIEPLVSRESLRRKRVEMPGFEPGASYMRSKRSTTELHPRTRNWWAWLSTKFSHDHVTGKSRKQICRLEGNCDWQNTKGPAGIRTQDLLFTRQAL